MGFMVRTQQGGRDWLKSYPSRIPMRLLKGAHSKGRVHRAFTANKIVFAEEGEEPVGVEAQVEEVPPGPVRFRDIWEAGTGFMIRTGIGGPGWLKDYPTRIPMHLLKDSYSKGRVHRAYKQDKIFFESGGEAPVNEEEVYYGSQRSTEGMGSTEEEESGGEGDEPGVDTGGSRSLVRQLCFSDEGDEGPEGGGGEPSGEGNGSGGVVQRGQLHKVYFLGGRISLPVARPLDSGLMGPHVTTPVSL